ncbi:MAG: thioesterase family protein [Pseudomonadota bacterium]
MAPKAGARVEDYKYWTDERVRFNDLDVLGHVNNIAYAVYVENARASFLGETGLWVMGARIANVIVRTEMDYLREVQFLAQLRVGVKVLAVGKSSYTLGIGIFKGEDCVLVARNIIVRFDSHTRGSVPLDDAARALLRPYLATS